VMAAELSVSLRLFVVGLLASRVDCRTDDAAGEEVLT